MHIGFLVQNETHAENAALLAEQVPAIFPGARITAVTFDGVYHQNTAARLPAEVQRAFPLTLPVAFYRLRIRNRVKTLAAASSDLRAIARGFDAIIAGNDGAVQRIILSEARRLKKPTALLIDGILFPRPEDRIGRLRFEGKRFLSRILTCFGLSHFGPSIVGHYPVTRVFVMNELVRRTLVSQRTSNDVCAVQMPRSAMLAAAVSNLRMHRRHATHARLLYATSAFKWHGHSKEAVLQIEEVHRLAELAHESGSIEIRFRVHPRESEADYNGLFGYGGCSLSTSQEPLAEDLAWCDAVLTPRSTLALDALAIGIPALVTTLSFPPPPEGSAISIEDLFPRIKSDRDFLLLSRGVDVAAPALAMPARPAAMAIASLLGMNRPRELETHD